MLIGNSYADNKIYRGIEHYNNRPLTARDLHEQSDTDAMKNAFIMNNLLGRAGILNKPGLTLSENNTKVSLDSPLVLMIEGDVVLVQSDSAIVDSNASSVPSTAHHAYLVGWYQKIDNTTKLRAYGGVRNAIIENDIVDPDIDVLTSTRYQFRWMIICSSSLTDTIIIPLPDKDGNEDSFSITKLLSTEIISDNGARTYELEDHSKKDYIENGLVYAIPILSFKYNQSSGFSNVSLVKPLKPSGILEELDTYQGMITIHNTINMVYPISQYVYYDQKCSLQVLYNGVVLTRGVHYNVIDNEDSDSYINLIDFTTEIDDEITFIVTKLAESE